MTETQRDSNVSGIPKALSDELLLTLVDSVQEYAILVLDPQGHTGWGQEADRQKATESGFHHHCVKPVSEATLRDILLDVQRRPHAEVGGPGGHLGGKVER
jgi:hypothetical protein